MMNPLRALALALSLCVAGGAVAQDDVKKKPKAGAKPAVKDDADDEMPKNKSKFKSTTKIAPKDEADDEMPKKKAAAKHEDDADHEKHGNLPPTPKAGKVYLRPGWGQLGLDAKQKGMYEKAYLAGKAKIEVIDKQLEKAKDDLDDSLEAILTPAQKKELNEFKAAQKKARDEAAAEKKAKKKLHKPETK